MGQEKEKKELVGNAENVENKVVEIDDRKILIPVIKETENELPKYQTPQSAGCDARAELQTINQDFFFDTKINEVKEGKIKSICILPLGRCLIPTGLKMAIPDGYEIQIRPRSGWALKFGLSLANCVATIDADYRDEVRIILINFGKKPIIIEQGERIGQFVLNKIEQFDWKIVKKLDVTERKGGYGHTGTK